MTKFILVVMIIASLGIVALATGPQEPSHVINVPVDDTTNRFQREVNKENRRVFEGIRAAVDSADTAFELADTAYLLVVLTTDTASLALFKAIANHDTLDKTRDTLWALRDTVHTDGELASQAYNYAVDSVVVGSTWVRIKIRDASDDSVVIVPAVITVYSDGASQLNLVHTIGTDSCSFIVDAAGNITIDPSSELTIISGNLDALGTVNSDSLDIDGGVDISTNLEVGEDIIVEENLNVVSTEADQFNIVHTPGADSASFQVDADGNTEVYTSGGYLSLLDVVRIVTSTLYQFVIVHTVGDDSTSFSVGNTGDLIIDPSGGDVIVDGNIKAQGGIVHVSDPNDGYLYIDIESTGDTKFTADGDMRFVSLADSITISDNTYINAELHVDGIFNKIRSGKEDTDTCQATEYFVVIDPAFPDTNYSVSLTPYNGWLLYLEADSALEVNGFWMGVNSVDRFHWIAVHE